MNTWHILVTCEHGGNYVPPEYRSLFKPHKDLLSSHRGYDIGALRLALSIAKEFNVPCIRSEVSRLVVELNRSVKHPNLFSKVTDPLQVEDKDRILKKYYFPYREKVEKFIESQLHQKRKVLHLSIHSFTPVLDGQRRNADIGLLYDSRRLLETRFCSQMKHSLQSSSPWIVRKNYPYLGKSDGLTTYLRSKFSRTSYLGIEIEFNQQLAMLSPDVSKYRLLLPFTQSVSSIIRRMH